VFFFSGGKKDLERRLTLLLKIKKVSKPILIFALVNVNLK